MTAKITKFFPKLRQSASAELINIKLESFVPKYFAEDTKEEEIAIIDHENFSDIKQERESNFMIVLPSKDLTSCKGIVAPVKNQMSVNRRKITPKLKLYNYFTKSTPKPFITSDLKCHKCGKTFFNLHKHKNHDCDLQCRICGEKIQCRMNMAKHMKSKHPEKLEDPVFVCKICGLKYVQEHCLNIHIKRKHPDVLV